MIRWSTIFIYIYLYLQSGHKYNVQTIKIISNDELRFLENKQMLYFILYTLYIMYVLGESKFMAYYLTLQVFNILVLSGLNQCNRLDYFISLKHNVQQFHSFAWFLAMLPIRVELTRIRIPREITGSDWYTFIVVT